LHCAVNGNQKEMVALLLKNKADPNARSETTYGEGGAGYTPLLMATARVLPDIVDLLLASGADPNLGNDTRTPILNALNNENPIARQQMLKSLLEHGAALEVRDSNGDTPLLLAARRADKDALALLLANKADVNAQNKNGLSPLHVLVLLNQNRDAKLLVKLLLAAGADVNARDKDGNTPLWSAADGKQREMAELLLAHKADPNERNNAGHTSLDLAKRQLLGAAGIPGTQATAPGQKSEPETIADLLRQHGAVDDLPQPDRIEVRRRSTGYCGDALRKGAQNWNQFTLLDLIGVQYSFLAASPNEEPGGTRYWSHSFASKFGQSLPFPDLAHLRIRRPAPEKGWLDRTVDLRPVLESGDCSKDARLEWGDVVEIPEADHPLNEQWTGFSRINS
jgi:hypothetical protein